jgi:hypothetical protein
VRKEDWSDEGMVMRCPICGSQLAETSSKRFKRGLKVIAVIMILTLAALTVYWIWPWPVRVDYVPFLMPNTLVSSVHQDGIGSPGGIIAVYGNISNLESRSINPIVSIDVNMSSNWAFYSIRAGLIEPGDSEYFSWVYHLDLVDVPSTNVTIRVWGS